MSSNVLSIDFTERNFSINPRQTRREGRIPATVYGRGAESISIEVDLKTFTHMYLNQNPHLITLEQGQKKIQALVKKVHYDHLTASINNIEFLLVREDVKVTLSIQLVLENESPAVKLGGMLLQLADTIEVECLPKDLPNSIVVDLAKLVEVDTALTIADLSLPAGVVATHTSDTVLVKVVSPKAESAEPAAGGATAEAAAAE